MTKLGAILAIAGLVAGCGKGKDSACEYVVAVSLEAPEGGPVPGLVVSVTAVDAATPEEIACADTGDGVNFECVVPEPGEYNVYGEADSFEPYGQRVDVAESEDCASPAASVTGILNRESAV